MDEGWFALLLLLRQRHPCLDPEQALPGAPTLSASALGVQMPRPARIQFTALARWSSLKEALPQARRFGVLFASTAPSHVPALEAAETAARQLAVTLRHAPVHSESDLRDAIPSMARDGVDGLMLFATPLMVSTRAPIAELAIRHRLPSVFGAKDNVLAGGLMSYAPDILDLTRRAASYVDRILEGEKPAHVPVEQATRYELTINLKTAQALGLTILPTLLARADEVIE